MACHTANLAFMALKLGLPVRVSAQSGEINPETYPAWATITYEFPAREGLPPVKLTWYEGASNGKRNLPSADLFPAGFNPSDSGSLFIGTKGKMYSPSDYGSEQILWPEAAYKDFKDPAPTLPRIEGGRNEDDNQKKEWVAGDPRGQAVDRSLEFRLRIDAHRIHAAGQRGGAFGRGHRIRPLHRPDHQPLLRRPVSQALFPQGVGDLRAWPA